MGKKYKTVEPSMWKPTQAGDSIEGVYIHHEPATENVGDRYYIETSPGVKVFLWGSAVLDSTMKLLKPGTEVRITYEGTKKNQKNQDTHMWKVEEAVEEGAEEQPTQTAPTTETKPEATPEPAATQPVNVEDIESVSQ